MTASSGPTFVVLPTDDERGLPQVVKRLRALARHSPRVCGGRLPGVRPRPRRSTANRSRSGAEPAR